MSGLWSPSASEGSVRTSLALGLRRLDKPTLLHHFCNCAIIRTSIEPLTCLGKSLMRKFLCSFALFAAVGMLVASVSPEAPAQQKDKKEVKKDKKDAKADGPGKVEVYQTKDGWRFRVYGPDGKLLAVGVQGYAKTDECLDAVELLKSVLEKAKVTEIPKKKKE